nr:WYL domain-containing protein [Cryobacterium lyxosi]
MNRWSKESPTRNCPSRRYSGDTTNRQLEPLHLVHTMGHWYLLAYSLDAADWRTFRVDRLSEAQVTDKPGYPRKPPADDLREDVTMHVASGWCLVTGTVRVHAPHAPRATVAPGSHRLGNSPASGSPSGALSVRARFPAREVEAPDSKVQTLCSQ